RAIRTSISCSRASPTSRAGPVPASICSHPAESGSSRGTTAEGCSTPESAGTMATMLPTSPRRHLYLRPRVPGLAGLLHQVDAVVAVRIARRAAAFGVAEPGVETRRLEGVGAQGHPVAAA